MMASILQDLKGKIKSALTDPRYFTAILLVLVALTAFGLGRQSVRDGEVEAISPIENMATTVIEADTSTPRETFYVASKNGQVYHLPHCSGAKNISEANKLTFASKAEAEAAGYRPAANCKGI